ncbi:MAG: DUF2007 domain-containing protein [Alphaproteobacteria bacterium]|nr:DUF2007 domain-containing protein [Alphaproteobacteria bacterium]
MKPLLKTNDVVLLSFAQSLLKDARIDTLVLDTNASIMDGSLGMLPRRLMVADDDYDCAVKLLRDALESPAPPET